MKKASIAILVILALLIGLVAGFYSAGMSKVGPTVKSNTEVKGQYKDTFADGWRAAKEKLEESGFFGPANMFDNKTVYGTVKEVSGDKIVIETTLRNPLEDESLKVRNVSVKGADITLRTFKTVEEVNRLRSEAEKELKSLNEKMSVLEKQLMDCQPGGDATVDPCAAQRSERDGLMKKIGETTSQMMNEYENNPNPSLFDIKPGYTVVVRSSEDIYDKTDFSASNIEVTQNIREVAMPPVDQAAATIPVSETMPAAPANNDSPVQGYDPAQVTPIAAQ